MSNDRSHLVRTVVQDKSGNLVTRWINPNKGGSDYAEHRRMVREELARHSGNTPPGTQKIREMVLEQEKDRMRIGAMRDAENFFKNRLRDDVPAGETVDFSDFEGDPGFVKRGKTPIVFNELEASRELTSKEFRECRSDSLLSSKLRDKYPDIYAKCVSQDPDRVNIQIDRADEDLPLREDMKREVWNSIRQGIGKKSYDDMSTEDVAAALANTEVQRRRLEASSAERLEQIKEDFDHGDTYLGDVRVRKTYGSSVDWDRASELLGDRIEACRSDKILAAKVKEIKGNEWYDRHRTIEGTAPVAVKWY